MSANGSPIDVLCVDDEPGLADLTGTFLERFNDRLSVTATTNGGDAVEYLDENPVDCIVSDYDMPGMDGLEFLESVRATNPDLPFILFTGRGSEEIASDAISAGVTDYMQKESSTDQYQVLAKRIRNLVTRYRAQDEAQRAQQRAETILTASPDAILVSVDGEHVYANPAAVELFDAESDDDLIGTKFMDLVHFTDRDVHQPDLTVLRDDEQILRRVRHTAQVLDGHPVDVEVTARDIEWDGQSGTLAILRDLTERQRREQELRETTRQFHTVLDTVEAAIFMKDHEGRYLLMNKECREILGLDGEQDVVGKTDEDILPADTARQLRNHDLRVLEMGETIEFEEDVPTANGVRSFLTCKTPVFDDLGEPVAVCAVSTDITDRKEREQQLARSQQQYRALAEHLPNGAVLLFDTDLRHQLAHGDVLEELGFSQSDLLGNHLSELFEGEFLTELMDLYQATLDGETCTREIEYGGYLFQIRTVPIRDEDGEIHLGLAMAQDITDRKERDAKLKTLQERVEFALDVTDAIMWAENLDRGITTTMIGPVERLFGVGPERVADPETFFEYAVHPDDHAAVEQVYGRVLRGETDRFEIEFRTHPDHSEVRWIESNGYLQTDTDTRMLVGFSTDITDRKERERELERQNDRLEEFASVVSHDLRNPLNVAQGRLELARDDCTSEHLQPVERSLDRMATLIEDLLVLARQGHAIADVETIALNALVAECWQTIDTADATLTVVHEGRFEADESRVRQVFENLFRNAVEHGGNDVTVTVGKLADGTGLFIEDNGAGIPPGERDQIFTSGHSTKQDGTGLGLNIVKRVADAHGWDIDVTNGSEGGARFEITGVEFGAT